MEKKRKQNFSLNQRTQIIQLTWQPYIPFFKVSGDEPKRYNCMKKRTIYVCHRYTNFIGSLMPI